MRGKVQQGGILKKKEEGSEKRELGRNQLTPRFSLGSLADLAARELLLPPALSKR